MKIYFGFVHCFVLILNSIFILNNLKNYSWNPFLFFIFLYLKIFFKFLINLEFLYLNIFTMILSFQYWNLNIDWILFLYFYLILKCLLLKYCYNLICLCLLGLLQSLLQLQIQVFYFFIWYFNLCSKSSLVCYFIIILNFSFKFEKLLNCLVF